MDRKTIISTVLLKVLICVRLSCCYYVTRGASFLEDSLNISLDSYEIGQRDESFNVNTVGCIIPSINIRDVTIQNYIHKTNKRAKLCYNYNTRLLASNQTHIWVKKYNFIYHNVEDESNFMCCYQSFHKPLSVPNTSSYFIDNIQYLSCILFHDIIEVSNEFVKVNCSYENETIYEQYFVFTPKKDFTYTRHNPFKPWPANKTNYNIIMLGMGSMSRQNFYRTMPKTLGILKKRDAIELKGYNTVAGDTFENMMPVLVGMNNTEIQTTCWKDPWSSLDNCPYIWERFKDVGYYTALVEDTSKLGMFNQWKRGFQGSPTDYYLHPFIHETETLNKKNSIKYKKYAKVNEILSPCMGDKYYYEFLINYIRRLTTTLGKSKLFGLFWETTMSHDNLNDPALMDKAYGQLINKMESTGYLNETILIFLSDHGMDTGNIVLTKQGQIEQRLPFVFILMPPSFRTQYKLAYHNLNVNKERLTTPFDLHETLVDLIDMSAITKTEILKRNSGFYTHNRGISLFLPIPKNRTCDMAGIRALWCACYNDVNVEPNSPILMDAVSYFTNKTNEMLKSYPQCLKLIVDDIIIAKEMIPIYTRYNEWRDFNMVVRMAPGGGMFETIMRFYNNSWTIVDRVKRLNFPDFGTMCIEDATIKLFCFCK
ncbi:uncharacterized protein LOC111352639 [Spodoptera litura]|uniref:Uncharacterized protein LOC111352639 n=1 Tax=Spodoptera litura TaxID=69820 RepID=A0A9J7E315_SPOLT|nr:uncharacterized protein LOC111352639 [Spodoptera litura]